ncbi:DMT family transporter [Roseiconus nitratireducens]|uniref:DMT family transporter n=1 Tax=Roseiconus nitratireducens TaxID=2605748 RepID=A0A5M6DE80_9BACT|nr:DMT family transporter [Roseiconus nitratireducens]KAA5544592.1 DMT family transporter [Roseiconus nitratireducens]
MERDSPTSPAEWFGPFCGMAAAVLYTLANIALRDCVAIDAYLVSAVKATPTVLVLGPLLGWMSFRGSTLHINRRRMPTFIAASFGAQFFGNAAFQKALGHIGLAASVPITLGVLIVGGALLGAMLLGEPVGRQKVIAMVLLIVAVVVLSVPHCGPEALERSASNDNGVENDGIGHTLETDRQVSAASVDTREPVSAAVRVIVGSLWAATSGIAYALFGVMLRQTLQTGMRASTTMFISGLVGVTSLWSYSFLVLGSSTISATPSRQWLVMASAGVFNFLAFVALTAALRRLPVVAVNLINASQVALAAIAGVVLFSEPVTVQLLLGITLTFVGLVILTRRTRASVVITD